jgi:hypothetical protein
MLKKYAMPSNTYGITQRTWSYTWFSPVSLTFMRTMWMQPTSVSYVTRVRLVWLGQEEIFRIRRGVRSRAA